MSVKTLNESLSELLGHGQDVMEYESDGNAMLELDREMRERGWQIRNYWDMSNLPTWAVTEIWKDDAAHKSYAKSEPLARALAAYKALAGKEWQLKVTKP